jgi:2'-5' RNA ligase
MAIERDGIGHAPQTARRRVGPDATLRLFVAVTLDTAVRQALAAAGEELRAIAPGVSWVRAENLHLTLKFLGAVDEAMVPALIEALHRAVERHRPFGAEVRGLGAFPSAARARVVWAGVTTGVHPLRALARAVDDATADLGFPREERPFAAHVTLARVRELRKSPALAQVLETGAARPFGVVSVKDVTLMRSELSPRGSRYTSLGLVALAGQAP